MPGYWNALRKSAAAVEATPKQRLPLILGSRSVMLWWAGGRVYCTAAASPPWSFPLVDAQLSVVDGRPAVRSTLDGSLFDLQSGEALEWCPREEAAFSFRNLLSAAKAKEPKQRLPIYALRQALSGDLEVFFPVQP